jgi:hypothetical protein
VNPYRSELVPSVQKTFYCYRHADRVAFHFEDTKTLYVSADLADRIALRLIRVAQDIREVEKFSNSQIPDARYKEHPDGSISLGLRSACDGWGRGA